MFRQYQYKILFQLLSLIPDYNYCFGLYIVYLAFYDNHVKISNYYNVTSSLLSRDVMVFFLKYFGSRDFIASLVIINV